MYVCIILVTDTKAQSENVKISMAAISDATTRLSSLSHLIFAGTRRTGVRSQWNYKIKAIGHACRAEKLNGQRDDKQGKR